MKPNVTVCVQSMNHVSLKVDGGFDVKRCAGCVSANTRPHQLAGAGVTTALLCKKGIQVAAWSHPYSGVVTSQRLCSCPSHFHSHCDDVPCYQT